MIYKLKLKIDKKIDNPIYNGYWLLFSIIKDDEVRNIIKNNALKIEYYNNEATDIVINIYWENNYNYLIDYLLWIKKDNLIIISIEIISNYFRPNFVYEDYDKIIARFKTPTIIKILKYQYVFPIFEKILKSINKKYNKYFKWFDEESLDLLWKKILVWKYNLKTKLIKIKEWYKHWFIWYVEYHLKNLEDTEKKMIYELINFWNFSGVWTWTRLWLWNVIFSFLNKKNG